MSTNTRRDLLKGTVAAGLGLGLAASPSVVEAQSGAVRVINVHGTVFLGAVAIQISITVEGPRDDLSGSGWDLPPHGAAGACFYTQEGSANSETVELAGIVLLANEPVLNVPVTTRANFKTGEITWTFGTAVFTGVGTVVQR